MPKQQAPALAGEDTARTGPKELEVNVLFTDVRATRAALRAATELTRDLQASIRVRAIIAVPHRLPLERPQVSIPFWEEVLSGLVSECEQNSLDITAHLYLSRNRIQTLLQILPPNSLVVIAGRKRPWPSSETRMANRLLEEGHRVVFIPLQGGEVKCAEIDGHSSLGRGEQCGTHSISWWRLFSSSCSGGSPKHRSVFRRIRWNT